VLQGFCDGTQGFCDASQRPSGAMTEADTARGGTG
jgi:hypothetical protein